MKNKPLGKTCVGRAMSVILVAAASLGLSACVFLPQKEPPAPEVVQAPPPEPPPPEPEALYQWYGDGRSVSHIEVDVDMQKAVFYDGPYEIGWSRVASGVRSFPTPTGEFAVTEKEADKRSNIYGKIYNRKGKLVRRNAERGVHPIPSGGRFEGAKMPFFMRLTNDGIGLHAGPIPKPGNPASHGCIRLPQELAPVLYAHVDVGTPVSIVGSGPSYSTYLANHRKKRARRAPATRAATAETVVAATEDATGAAATAGTDSTPAGGSAEAAAVPTAEPALAQEQPSEGSQPRTVAEPETAGVLPASAAEISGAGPIDVPTNATTTAEDTPTGVGPSPTSAPAARPTGTAAASPAPAAPAASRSGPPPTPRSTGPTSGMADAGPPDARPASAPETGRRGQGDIETGALTQPIAAPTGNRRPEES